MKMNEFIAEMQKTLTALMEQQANEVSELEAYKDEIKKLREQNARLEVKIRLLLLTGTTKVF